EAVRASATPPRRQPRRGGPRPGRPTQSRTGRARSEPPPPAGYPRPPAVSATWRPRAPPRAGTAATGAAPPSEPDGSRHGERHDVPLDRDIGQPGPGGPDVLRYPFRVE